MDLEAPLAPRRAPLPWCTPLAWLGVMGLLAGCGSDSGLLARIGGGTVTRDDFVRAAEAMRERSPGPPDSARAALLQELVQRELLVQAALREGLDRDTLFLDYRGNLEREMLRERMVRELAGGPVAVSPAEVEELYRWRGQESRCRLIHALSRELARAALEQLQQGEDFATVADRFNVPGQVPPGGDLGFVTPGSLIGPLDAALRTAPTGRVVGPIEVRRQGWILMRIDERRPRQQASLEAQRAELTGLVEQHKQYETLTRAIARLGVAYGVRVVPGAPQEVVVKLLPLAQAMMEQSGGPGLAARLPQADRATVLVEYHGGVYTLGDAAADLEHPRGARPNLYMLPTVEWWIESQALERVLLLEARRRRLADEPEFERQVRDQAYRHLTDDYLARQVLGRISIEDEDLREAYQRHADAFVRLGEVRLLTATLPDSAAAAGLIESVGPAGTLREVVAAASVPVRVRSEKVRYPSAQPLWRTLEGRFLRMSPGEYVGPLRTERGWMVAQLVSKEQGAPSYEAVQAEVRSYLQGEVIDRKHRKRLAMLTDSLRKAIPVNQYPERLRRIPWPVPGPSPTLGS